MELTQNDMLKLLIICKSLFGPIGTFYYNQLEQIIHDYNEYLYYNNDEDEDEDNYDNYNANKRDYKPTYKYEDEKIIIEIFD